jgi:hypothetical protein
MRLTLRPLAILLFGAPLLNGDAVVREEAQRSGLVLELACSVEGPWADREIAGAAVLDPSGVAVWDRTGSVLAIGGCGHGWREWHPAGGGLLNVRFIDRNRIAALVRHPMRIAIRDSLGTHVTTVPVEGLMDAAEATSTGSGWFVRNEAGDTLWQVGPNGQVTPVHRDSWPRLPNDAYHMSATDTAVIFTSLDPRVRPNVFIDVTSESNPKDLRFWSRGPAEMLGLPILGLSRGFLQTLVDLRSDNRVLLYYEGLQQLPRVIELKAPFGLFAASHTSQTLVGLADLDERRVLIFRYRLLGAEPSEPSRLIHTNPQGRL